MRATSGVLLLLCCTLFVGRTVGAPYQIDTSAPRTLTISSSPAQGGTTDYSADGRVVVKEEYGAPRSDGSFPLRRQRKVRLTVQQWAAFWQAVDRFAIEHWRTVYTPEGMRININDGEAWRVEMQKSGHIYRCEGARVYPSLEHPAQRTLERAALTGLIEVFERRVSAEGSGR